MKTALDPAITLLNGTELAEALNVTRAFVTAMKHKGFAFSLGGRTTLNRAIAWLDANPTFRPTPPRQPSMPKATQRPRRTKPTAAA